jgi:hypothetical protein
LISTLKAKEPGRMYEKFTEKSEIRIADWEKSNDFLEEKLLK